MRKQTFQMKNHDGIFDCVAGKTALTRPAKRIQSIFPVSELAFVWRLC